MLTTFLEQPEAEMEAPETHDASPNMDAMTLGQLDHAAPNHGSRDNRRAEVIQLEV
jgi:hypothetical protein